jgi:hypothetical protein
MLIDALTFEFCLLKYNINLVAFSPTVGVRNWRKRSKSSLTNMQSWFSRIQPDKFAI